MKKFIISILSFIILLGISFADYVPTSQDKTDIKNLKNQLDELVLNDSINLWNFYNQTNNLVSQYSGNDRLNYMLGELKTYLYTILSNQKGAAKSTSKVAKKEFLDEYNTGYDTEIQYTVDQCIGRYNTIDDLSFAYNFPTAITLAVRYRESNCGYLLPKNGNGPFQITSKDYGTGDITQELFTQTVQDFLEFAKNKLDKYNLSGKISYNNYDMDGIINFAALYNGGTKSGNLIIPNEPKYVFDGYGTAFSGAKRFGILPQTLKILERELDNKY